MMKTTTTRPTSHQASEAAGETTGASRRPSHYVYAVRKNDTGKGFWTRIGRGLGQPGRRGLLDQARPDPARRFRHRGPHAARRREEGGAA